MQHEAKEKNKAHDKGRNYSHSHNMAVPRQMHRSHRSHRSLAGCNYRPSLILRCRNIVAEYHKMAAGGSQRDFEGLPDWHRTHRMAQDAWVPLVGWTWRATRALLDRSGWLGASKYRRS